MRSVPAIRERRAAPTLGDLVSLLGAGYGAWRLRRITSGLQRAAARGDQPAVARWASRGDRALADLEAFRCTRKAGSHVPCKAASRQSGKPGLRDR